MLNFRKLKQDYSQTMLKEGRALNEKKMIASAKIVKLEPQSVRLNCRVMGSFDNTYQCEIEIDRKASTTLDSDCDCPYKYDCQHLAATLYYLEEHFDEILVAYSKENDVEKKIDIDAEEKETLRETIKEAENKETLRRGKKQQRELLDEYVGASQVLGRSPFFHSDEEPAQENVELALLIALPAPSPVQRDQSFNIEIQLALRLPFRSKPLNILNVREFLDAIRYREPMYIGSKRCFFDMSSFDPSSAAVLKLILDNARYADCKEERNLRLALLDNEAFGVVLAQAYDIALSRGSARGNSQEEQALIFQPMPCLYGSSLEEPICFAAQFCLLDFALEYIEAPAPKILIKPTVVINGEERVELVDVCLFACSQPGMIYKNIFYRIPNHIRRRHLRNLEPLSRTLFPNLCGMQGFQIVKLSNSLSRFLLQEN
jgi:hypothetical protein